jgi:hypothetical protein
LLCECAWNTPFTERNKIAKAERIEKMCRSLVIPFFLKAGCNAKTWPGLDFRHPKSENKNVFIPGTTNELLLLPKEFPNFAENPALCKVTYGIIIAISSFILWTECTPLSYYCYHFCVSVCVCLFHLEIMEFY